MSRRTHREWQFEVIKIVCALLDKKTSVNGHAQVAFVLAAALAMANVVQHGVHKLTQTSGCSPAMLQHETTRPSGGPIPWAHHTTSHHTTRY